LISIQELERIKEVRQEHPMYQRYMCCGRTIGTRHAQTCPQTPDANGPGIGQVDIQYPAFTCHAKQQ